jgi:hypothetical protein
MEQDTLADTAADKANDKLYKAEYVGSGTFIISKPKRKGIKTRQSRLKNVRRDRLQTDNEDRSLNRPRGPETSHQSRA